MKYKILLAVVMPAMLLAKKPFTEVDKFNELRNKPVPIVPKLIWTNGGSYDVKGNLYTKAEVNAGPYSGTIEDAAISYLLENGREYGINPNSVENLKTIKVIETPATEHIRFRQTYRGIPVFGGEVVITRRKSDQMITFVSTRYYKNIHIDNINPVISRSQAYATSKSKLPILKVISYIEPELMIYPKDGGILVWHVQIPSDNPVGDWEFFVNARTGEIVFMRDQSKYTDGQGLVFNPDPLTTSHHYYGDSPEWQDNNDMDNDSLNGQRFLVTLHDLTNTGSGYSLDGPFVNLVDLESPPDQFPVLPDPNGFQYTRSQQEFEDVMVYYHVDNIQRYFQDTLGIMFANNEAQDCDPHGLDGADNSHYVPSMDYIAWGEGGVDDDEDADVILHEYGHAIQDDIVPGWGVSHEASAMGEGFGDYLAVTYAVDVDTFRWADVFTWDGHNPFWPGRSANMDNYHYPEDANREIHDAGQLWSSALMDVFWAFYNQGMTIHQARKIIDALVITHHTYLTASATMPEAANAIIQVDMDLFNGAHLGTILPIFDARGFIDMGSYMPQIVHDPLHDTEDVNGPYPVGARVIPVAAPIDTVATYYWTSLNPQDTVMLLMTPVTQDSFVTEIPGPGTEADISYYIYVVDTSGMWSTNPTGAPAQYHSFHVGPDNIPPTISHNPLPEEFPQTRWPATLTAVVTDNLGVDSVWVVWKYNGQPQTNFNLLPQDDSTYSAQFPLPTVELGDQIEYQIWAVDNASNPNVSVIPGPNNFYQVTIVQTLGIILVINDDDGSRASDEKGTAIRQFEPGETADSIASWLSQVGYDVTLEEAGSTNPTTWNDYDFIVWSSGEDITTVGQQTSSGGPPYADQRRQDLLNYLYSGGFIFFEGGELGWDAQASSGDPTFANNALHITDWDTDNPMNLTLVAFNHEIATTPNQLPTTIMRNDVTTTWGDGDALQLAPDATLIYGTTAYPADAGILVSNDEHVIFTAFNYLSLTDWDVAKDLLENIANYFTVRVEVEESKAHPQALLKIYPLRNSVRIRYSLPTPKLLSIRIYDATGRRVWTYRHTPTLRSGEITIQPRLTTGVYFIRVDAGNLQKKSKFVWFNQK